MIEDPRFQPDQVALIRPDFGNLVMLQRLISLRRLILCYPRPTNIAAVHGMSVLALVSRLGPERMDVRHVGGLWPEILVLPNFSRLRALNIGLSSPEQRASLANQAHVLRRLQASILVRVT